jgi:hypothetical protein
MAEAVDSTEVQQPAAAGDEDDRKLFVGGLPQDASQVPQIPQYQCCGSGSGIRRLSNKIRIWIRDEQPGSYFLELRNNFLGF